MSKWFTLGWYEYLFTDLQSVRNLICRMRGHPYGVTWYNASGFEPDMTCRNCDEDLG